MWQKGDKDGFKYWRNGEFLIEERLEVTINTTTGSPDVAKVVRYHLFHGSKFIDKFTFLPNAFKAAIDYNPPTRVVVTEDSEL